MSRSADVMIVGAGIVGAFCARALQDAGLDVLVVDARPPGGGATAACMGHVVVMDDSEAQFALCHRSRLLWDALADELPESAERDGCGTLWLAETGIAEDDEQMDAVRTKHAFYGERGVATEILDARQLAEAEPELRADLVGALRVPHDSVVYPPAVVAWLLRDVPTEIGTAVERVESDGDEARVVLEDGRRLAAGHVVVAAGVASLGLLGDSLRQTLPDAAIRPRKGHLVITDRGSERAPAFCSHQLVELGYLASAHGDPAAPSVAFNLQPRKTGQMLVGSSRQLGTTDPAVEPDIVRKMLERAHHFMPGIGRLQAIRTWTGFRPSTDDHLPYVGPIPGHESVVLAAGHEGQGITTAPGTAELVAYHVAGESTSLDGTAYLADRRL